MARRLLDFTRHRRSVVLRTTGVVVGAQVIMAAYGALTARFLGPSGKGIVTSVFTWSQLLSWVSVAGLGTSFSVTVAEGSGAHSDSDIVRHAVGSAVAFTVTVGALLAVVPSLILPQALARLGPGTSALTVICLATVPLQMLTILLLMIQLGLGRTRTYSLAQFVNPVVSALVGVTLVLTVRITPAEVVLSLIAGGLCTMAVTARSLPWRSMRLSLAALMADLRFGAKVQLGSLFRLTNLRLDILLMSTVVSASQVGLYSAANSALIPLSTFPVVAATLLSPRVAGIRRLGQASSAATQADLVWSKAVQYTLFAVAGAALTCALTPLFLPVLLGNSFAGSVRLVWILTPGYVALCFNNIIAAGTAGMKEPWIGTTAELVAVVITLVLLPILLPRLASEGAALVSTTAYVTAALVAGIGFARLRTRADQTLPVTDITEAPELG